MGVVAMMIFKLFIKTFIKKDLFDRLKQEVHNWAEKELSGTEKREGIIEMLRTEGIKISEWVIRSGLDLAYAEMTGFVYEPKEAKNEPSN